MLIHEKTRETEMEQKKKKKGQGIWSDEDMCMINNEKGRGNREQELG